MLNAGTLMPGDAIGSSHEKPTLLRWGVLPLPTPIHRRWWVCSVASVSSLDRGGAGDIGDKRTMPAVGGELELDGRANAER